MSVIRVAARDLGHNRMLSHGFTLGTLPGGGYGVRWRELPNGQIETEYWDTWDPARLGTQTHWFAWEPPHDPVRIEFLRAEYVFCQESVPESALTLASPREYLTILECR
jgi:hypothetical protein